ncbi:putative hydantoinase A [Bradyrhizobium sp. ORS 285]|uniref:hydantoinase/oxoprolinase N-terminal domain-containing protein n=1 Tax=Bradyrhizobium sp. ORS 285 TaxID=115808 RepID=UPI0002409F7B|nr:hydantoinase/oxoprolinase N-terminal domain-containing protein [Bradyrhizobium sp. ORS 285]CCD84048.1 putative hydantoinase A [Bradyrhizobium sp. ORS 285]SMX59976.1 putative hydantoinase A [Bradyrhizobium sp. ORS 285]
MKRIGIDVGGTNTDAVLIADDKVVHSVKAATTADVTSGILAALKALRENPAAAVPVDAVVIGTTHFINAVVQRRHLQKIGAVRIGMPASASLPPFCDWPADLAELVSGETFMLEGGHDYDGRPFMPLDTDGLKAAARAIKANGLRSVAVASSFSPLDPSCEITAREIFAEICPDVAVTLSHDLGRIGLLERENAALLNAALHDLAVTTVAAFRKAIADSGIDAPLFLTQNDGTVMQAEIATAFPVMSFASGATNSMRGAAYLSGLDDAMVVDVGGTTSDIGQLRHGFPREANAVVEVGGVRTLFRMPDLLSIGLGGGSHVAREPVRVGPVSVGYRLTSEALVFGGDQLTATDIAVAAGLIDIGERARVAHLPKALIDAALADAHKQLEGDIDRMKTEAGDVPLLAVGGGAFLVPERLAGISNIVRVPHGDCANAVGAAIAQVSGEADQVFRDLTRDEAIAAARGIAEDRAVQAGAERGTLKTVDVEDMPIAYLPGNALRVRVRVAGAIAEPDIGAAA